MSKIISSYEVQGYPWLRPDDIRSALPRWGHPRGLQVALPPSPAPRGLLRVFAPHLDHAPDRVINFVAIEPIPAGANRRGYSELEHSALDGVTGKRLWTLDPSDGSDRAVDDPSPGVVQTVDGHEELTVEVGVEPFDNGASVTVRLRFRSDRPYEVGVASSRRPESAQLDQCVLSATMGNFARLRRLELVDGVATPAELWPDHHGSGFTTHARFGLGRLRRTTDGAVEVSAVPDETAPHRADYAAGTAEHWRYVGAAARQTWRAADPDPQITAQVNGRYAYWMSEHPIPGGVAYENFELTEPFRPGRELIFAVQRLSESTVVPLP